MKWLIFAGALLLVYPASILLRRNARARPIACFLIGLFPFVDLGFFDINFLVHAQYRGDARGFEVTLLDLLLLAVFLSQPRRRLASPFLAARCAYFLAALVSVAAAAEPLFAWFSVWSLVRMYFAFEVVYQACRSNRLVAALLAGLAVGVTCQFGLALAQRYLLGIHQTRGFFAHQNSLGSALILVTPPLFALVLARWGGWLYRIAVIGAAASIVMSLSRGALAIFAFQSAAMALLSLMRSRTSWKVAVLSIGLLGSGAIGLKAADTIVDRFTHAPPGSGETRSVMNAASSAMLSDHPLGIGINQYSLVVTRDAYFERASTARERPRHPLDEKLLYGGIVHNIYWLTAAELGYPGILAFGWLLLSPLCMANWHGWHTRNDVRGDLLLGMGIGLFGLYLHGILEWTFRQTQIAYLFWIATATTASLVRVRAPGPLVATRLRRDAARSGTGGPNGSRPSGRTDSGSRSAPALGR